MFSDGILREALLDCKIAHAGQVRKYTGIPYYTHPLHVAQILIECGVTDEDMLVAALLHDVLEDTDMPERLILDRYGYGVGALVVELTDPPVEGNRAVRKTAHAHRLARASGRGQTIKCADLISNTSDITKHAPDFARVYLREKEYVLSLFTRADPVVYARACASIKEAQAAL